LLELITCPPELEREIRELDEKLHDAKRVVLDPLLILATAALEAEGRHFRDSRAKLEEMGIDREQFNVLVEGMIQTSPAVVLRDALDDIVNGAQEAEDTGYELQRALHREVRPTFPGEIYDEDNRFIGIDPRVADAMRDVVNGVDRITPEADDDEPRRLLELAELKAQAHGVLNRIGRLETRLAAAPEMVKLREAMLGTAGVRAQVSQD